MRIPEVVVSRDCFICTRKRDRRQIQVARSPIYIRVPDVVK